MLRYIKNTHTHITFLWGANFFYLNTKLSKMEDIECFCGAEVVRHRPLFIISSIAGSRNTTRIFRANQLCAGLITLFPHSTRAAPSHDNQWGQLTWKSSTPPCPSFPKTIAGLFQDLLMPQTSCWAVCPLISKQQLSSPSSVLMWWSEWDNAVFSLSLVRKTVGF